MRLSLNFETTTPQHPSKDGGGHNVPPPALQKRPKGPHQIGLMFIFQELLRELGRELEQTVGEVEGVQQMLARMELEKMGLQVGDSRMIWVFW